MWQVWILTEATASEDAQNVLFRFYSRKDCVSVYQLQLVDFVDWHLADEYSTFVDRHDPGPLGPDTPMLLQIRNKKKLQEEINSESQEKADAWDV